MNSGIRCRRCQQSLEDTKGRLSCPKCKISWGLYDLQKQIPGVRFYNEPILVVKPR